MATPSLPGSQRTGDNTPNHQTASTQGGASSRPTPATNTGGGTGWGDKGFFKGSERPRRVGAGNPTLSMGEFLGLKSVKGAASENFENRVAGASGMGDRTSCETEDHSFMEHRPGCSKTLPGWSKTKGFVKTLHGQGR